MMQIIDGKSLAAGLRQEVAAAVTALQQHGRAINFAAVLVGDDPASQIYVRNKRRACEQVGINFTLHQLPSDSSVADVANLLQDLSRNPAVQGILLQLPLPAALADQTADLLNLIDPKKDVDGLTEVNLGRLAAGRPQLVPCTAQGVVTAIQSVCPNLTGKNVVVIGRSQIVGRPTSLLLTNLNATVTVCHRHTQNLTQFTQAADIVVVAAGQPGLLTGQMVKAGAIIIDVGINRLPNGQIVGDVDQASLTTAAAVTPVPGGIGPLTVAYLLKNLVLAEQLQHGA